MLPKSNFPSVHIELGYLPNLFTQTRVITVLRIIYSSSSITSLFDTLFLYFKQDLPQKILRTIHKAKESLRWITTTVTLHYDFI